MAEDDFDDFFDSPGQPSNRHLYSKKDDDDLESDRRSCVSSTRSQSSVKIEARVPSATYSDSDSDIENRYEQSSHSKGSSKNQRSKRKDNVSSKPPRAASAKSAWNNKGAHSHKLNSNCNNGNNSRSPSRSSSQDSLSHSNKDTTLDLHDYSSDSDTEIDTNRESGRKSRYTSRSLTHSHRSSDGDESYKYSARSRTRSRSHSESSQWSTGSEGESERKPLSSRPKSSPRRSRHRSSSESSISVSSLSDVETESKAIPSSNKPTISERSLNSTITLADTVDKDRMNLQILLSALLDADSEANHQQRQQEKRKNVMIVSPDRDRGVSGAERRQLQKSKSNYTFSNDRARMIDLENQRLLKNILAQRAATTKHHQEQRQPLATPSTSKTESKAGTKARKSTDDPVRVTHATVNRLREQQKIERENLALLRRLNQIKPSNDISRTKQLTDYNKQMAYHCPQLRTVTQAPTLQTQQRSHSAQAMNISSAASTGRRSRPSSASNIRPGGAYMSPVGTGPRRPASATTRRPSSAGNRKKPEWQTGW